MFTDCAADFADGLEANHFKGNHLIDKVSPHAFIPRKIFGDYVLENLEKVQHEPQGWLRIRIDEVISVLSSGSTLHANQVILALENFPPADWSRPSFQLPQPEIKHPRKMLLWIRQLIRNNPDVPWSAILDGLRPYTKKYGCNGR